MFDCCTHIGLASRLPLEVASLVLQQGTQHQSDSFQTCLPVLHPTTLQDKHTCRTPRSAASSAWMSSTPSSRWQPGSGQGMGYLRDYKEAEETCGSEAEQTKRSGPGCVCMHSPEVLANQSGSPSAQPSQTTTWNPRQEYLNTYTACYNSCIIHKIYSPRLSAVQAYLHFISHIAQHAICAVKMTAAPCTA